MQPTSRDAPVVLYRSVNLCSAVWGDLFIADWRARATLEDFRAVMREQRTFALSLGDKKHASLTLVRPDAMHTPSSEMLSLLDSGMRDINPRIKCAALALTADGFGASIIRSVITGAMVVQRAEFARKVVSSLYQALEWLAPQVTTPSGGVATAGQLARVLNALEIPSA